MKLGASQGDTFASNLSAEDRQSLQEITGKVVSTTEAVANSESFGSSMNLADAYLDIWRNTKTGLGSQETEINSLLSTRSVEEKAELQHWIDGTTPYVLRVLQQDHLSGPDVSTNMSWQPQTRVNLDETKGIIENPLAPKEAPVQLEEKWQVNQQTIEGNAQPSQQQLKSGQEKVPDQTEQTKSSVTDEQNINLGTHILSEGKDSLYNTLENAKDAASEIFNFEDDAPVRGENGPKKPGLHEG